jgi:hypothetical protein
MILHLDKYDDLYLGQLKTSIANAHIKILCPPGGYCDSTCCLQELCELLTAAYNDVCQEESKRNATKP